MTQIVPAQQRITNMRELLGRMKGEIAKAAPKHMTADRIIRVAMTSIQKVPQLAECTPESFLGCLLTCTQRGLAPDSASQHAHLIPFKDHKKGVTVCTLIFGYKGLMDLALRHPGVLSFHVPQIVYEQDEFDYQEGQEPKLFHKPAQRPDRGAIVAFYAVAKLASGDRPFVWMWLHEVEKVRDAVYKWQDKPWKTHFGAMGLKTVVIRLCKWLPATPDLQAAITLDEQAAAGVPQSIESVVIDGQPANGKTTKQLEDFVDPPAEPEEPPAEPIASVDLKPRRDAIKEAWIKIPPEDRPGVLNNLTLKGAVKKLKHIDDIEGVDNDKDLEAVQEACVDARRDF